MISCVRDGGEPAIKCTCCLTVCCGDIVPCDCVLKPSEAGGDGSVGAGVPSCQEMQR